jgi:hypothetical protein
VRGRDVGSPARLLERNVRQSEPTAVENGQLSNTSRETTPCVIFFPLPRIQLWAARTAVATPSYKEAPILFCRTTMRGAISFTSSPAWHMNAVSAGVLRLRVNALGERYYWLSNGPRSREPCRMRSIASSKVGLWGQHSWCKSLLFLSNVYTMAIH